MALHANHEIYTKYNHVQKLHCWLNKDQRYMDNWAGGVVGKTYHKIQIVSCSSVKITVNGIRT